jgi:hypothetical protein
MASAKADDHADDVDDARTIPRETIVRSKCAGFRGFFGHFRTVRTIRTMIHPILSKDT